MTAKRALLCFVLLACCVAVAPLAASPAAPSPADAAFLLSLEEAVPQAPAVSELPGAGPAPLAAAGCGQSFCERERESCLSGCRCAIFECKPASCSSICSCPIICLDES